MNQNPFEYRYEDCCAIADPGKLVIGNALLEQTFDLRDGMPCPVSIRNMATGDEWLQPGAAVPLYRLPGAEGQKAELMRISAETDDDCGTASPHMCVKVDATYPSSSLVVRILWKLYPGRAFAQQEISVKRLPAGGEDSSFEGLTVRFSGEAKQKRNAGTGTAFDDYIHFLPLQELHSRYEIVELRDVTDRHNNLVRTVRGQLYAGGHEKFDGNIVFIEKTLRPSGLMVLKEGPTPLARLGAERDFALLGRQLYVVGTGLAPEEIADEDFLSACGCVIGVYNGTEMAKYGLLDAYHRNIHADRPDRDFFIMCNNWGDRSKDGRVSEPFLLRELEAAAQLGITHYQIDDGWQAGTTINSVNADREGGGHWDGYHASGMDFWAPHPERLPNGLGPVVSRARELGIRLGLWYSPDSADDMIHWEKDVRNLVSLHRKHGICHFKLDGIHLRSKRGERNLLRLMRKVVTETGNRVYFNLDTTAQVRLGYFGRTQYGGLFLENRYTDWQTYYPHWTLRNLWMLSKYVPARKLQMEFLNVRRNSELYGDDPLAPNACGILYSFAAVLFSNPLAWMELTGLSDTDAEELSRLIRLTRPHHLRMIAGHVLPIGEEPSGTGWTGLQATVSKRDGYILIFRERTEEAVHGFKLWGLSQERLRLERIAATAGRHILLERGNPLTAIPGGDGYRFELPAPFTFALYAYAIEEEPANR